MFLGTNISSLALSENITEYTTTHAITVSGLPSYSTIYYTLRITDESGNTRLLQNGDKPYSVFIPDYLSPELSHPDDVFITTDEELPVIIWTVTAQTPISYKFVIDSAVQKSVTWKEETISLDLKTLELTVGTHTIELVVQDLFGNVAIDVVVVTISPSSEPENTLGTFENTVILAGVSVIIFVSFLKWRKTIGIRER